MQAKGQVAVSLRVWQINWYRKGSGHRGSFTAGGGIADEFRSARKQRRSLKLVRSALLRMLDSATFEPIYALQLNFEPASSSENEIWLFEVQADVKRRSCTERLAFRAAEGSYPRLEMHAALVPVKFTRREADSSRSAVFLPFDCKPGCQFAARCSEYETDQEGNNPLYAKNNGVR